VCKSLTGSICRGFLAISEIAGASACMDFLASAYRVLRCVVTEPVDDSKAAMRLYVLK
jgi:hypothetical protein